MLPTPAVMDTAQLEVQGDVNLQDPGICGFLYHQDAIEVIRLACYKTFNNKH